MIAAMIAGVAALISLTVMVIMLTGHRPWL